MLEPQIRALRAAFRRQTARAGTMLANGHKRHQTSLGLSLPIPLRAQLCAHEQKNQSSLHKSQNRRFLARSSAMEWNARRWRQSIERFKAFMIPLTVPLGRSERRVAAAHYVQGLLMPGQRKSIEPIAARLGVDSQRLQQFMADSPWEETQLWRVIRQEVVPHFEPILGASERQSRQARPLGLRQNAYRQVSHRTFNFGALRTFQGPISFSPQRCYF